jgi:hypothetical protein
VQSQLAFLMRQSSTDLATLVDSGDVALAGIVCVLASGLFAIAQRSTKAGATSLISLYHVRLLSYSGVTLVALAILLEVFGPRGPICIFGN